MWRAKADALPTLPMIVVGSLRVGGAGKTPVTAELARQYALQGLRVGILAHAVASKIPEGIRKVEPRSDWRHSSDEAVWLAKTTGVPVWVTRNRWKAWKQLEKRQDLDLVICDDGLEDPRLKTCRRIILDWGDPCTHLWHLVPLGKCRSFLKDHFGAELWDVSTSKNQARVHFGISSIQNFQGKPLEEQAWSLCGIGDPARFVSDLKTVGVKLLGQRFLADHSSKVGDELQRLLSSQGHPVVMTRKDWMRLAPMLAENPRVFVAEQAVRLG